jgi:hypothetical protein
MDATLGEFVGVTVTKLDHLAVIAYSKSRCAPAARRCWGIADLDPDPARATIARAISIRCSSTRCCGRSAKLTAHNTFTLFQGGAALEAERIGAPAPVASKWVPTEAELREYDGNYPLWPTIALRVFSAGAKLFVQGFNQGPLEVSSVDKDTFVAERVGAEPICARGVLVRRYFNSMVCRQVEICHRSD